jgi:AcrR family transcriptional regulator
MTFEPLTPERRREMTRQHLLEAAAIVFARKGFHGATLDEVAKLAGFTKGAVYSNFKSKDDLFLALLEQKSERSYAVTAEILETGDHDRDEQFPRIRKQLFTETGTDFFDEEFDALLLEFVLYARRNPEAREKLAQSAGREREFARELIEREYAVREAAPEFPPEAMSTCALALFGGLSVTRLIDAKAVTAETVDVALALLYKAMSVN